MSSDIFNELQEFKARQFDENRKISRRVDELETRILELEEWTRKDEDRIYKKIGRVEDYMEILENKLEYIKKSKE